MADIARLLVDGRVVGSKKERQSAIWSIFKLLFFKVENTLVMFYVPLAKIR